MKKILLVFAILFVNLAVSQNVNYTYKANVDRIVDGDTFVIDLDLGFHITINDLHIRVLGVDTPEPRTKNALEKKCAKLISADLEKKILNKDIVVQSVNYIDGKFGRPLMRIWIHNLCINDYLIKNKLAKVNFGSKREEWTDSELNHIIKFYRDGKL